MSNSESARDQIIAILSPKMITLVADIENSIGQPIDFVIDPSVDIASSYVNESVANVTVERVKSRDKRLLRGIVHELLHLERPCVEKVPEPTPFPPTDDKPEWQTTASINNTIEHLVIVPREQGYGDFADDRRWAECAESNLRRISKITDPLARRREALFFSLDLDVVEDPHVTRQCEDFLNCESLLNDSRVLRAQVRDAVLREKPKAIAYVLKALALNPADFRLTTYDVKNRKRVEEEIPHVA